MSAGRSMQTHKDKPENIEAKALDTVSTIDTVGTTHTLDKVNVENLRPGGMAYVAGLRCLRCGRFFAPSAVAYLCGCRPNVGSDLGTLDVEFDYSRMKESAITFGPASGPESSPRATSLERYAPLLPIASLDSLSPLPVGDTPLYSAPRLGRSIGLGALYVKDDGRNPSASLKDRASAIAVAKAVESGSPVVATASTGNAAAALAQQAAAAGIPCVIFVPKAAPPAKIAQLLVFGAQVFAVRGSYDDAFDLCVTACERFGWYNRNTGMNPYMSEGKKTVSLEIAEQLGAKMGRTFHAPDVVFVSVGDGCIIGGIYKGFYDLIRMGHIERMPRIYGVQSERSNALYRAWRENAEIPDPVRADTRADSISVDAPRDAVKALRAVRATDGAFIPVSDGEILDSIPLLARLAGVFAEPAGAAGLAGCIAATKAGLVEPGEQVVIVNTGNGLKDIGAVGQVTGAPMEIEPTIDAVASWAAGRKSWLLD